MGDEWKKNWQVNFRDGLATWCKNWLQKVLRNWDQLIQNIVHAVMHNSILSWQNQAGNSAKRLGIHAHCREMSIILLHFVMHHHGVISCYSGSCHAKCKLWSYLPDVLWHSVVIRDAPAQAHPSIRSPVQDDHFSLAAWRIEALPETVVPWNWSQAEKPYLV